MIRVPALHVDCPSCGSKQGRRCRRLDDLSILIEVPHVLRRSKAAAEQARLNPEHVDGQLPLWPRKATS
jgi:hypothetical protein